MMMQDDRHQPSPYLRPNDGKNEYIASIDIAKRSDQLIMHIARKMWIRFEDGRYCSILSFASIYPYVGLDYIVASQSIKATLGDIAYNKNTDLVIDGTGVGEAVFDILRHEGLQPMKIVSTGGKQYSPITDSQGTFSYISGWNVPKADLVDATKILLQQRRIYVAPEVPYQDELKKQLQHYVATFSPSGNIRYGNDNEAEHDDYVTALMNMCWYFYEIEGAKKDFTLRRAPDLGIGSPHRDEEPASVTYNPADMI